MIPWANPSQKPNGIWIGSAVFEQMTEEHSYTLQWAALSPLKIALSHVGMLTPPSNTSFLGHPSPQPNGILIG